MTWAQIASGAVGIMFLVAFTFGPLWLLWRFSPVGRGRRSFLDFLGPRVIFIFAILLIAIAGLIVQVVRSLLSS